MSLRCCAVRCLLLVQCVVFLVYSDCTRDFAVVNPCHSSRVLFVLCWSQGVAKLCRNCFALQQALTNVVVSQVSAVSTLPSLCLVP